MPIVAHSLHSPDISNMLWPILQLSLQLHQWPPDISSGTHVIKQGANPQFLLITLSGFESQYHVGLLHH